MYKFVFDSCSVCWGVVLGPIVLFVFVLLKLVLKVPLCDPVFDELLEFVLLGEAAVGTRCPYCKRRRKKGTLVTHLDTMEITRRFINQAPLLPTRLGWRWCAGVE